MKNMSLQIKNPYEIKKLIDESTISSNNKRSYKEAEIQLSGDFLIATIKISKTMGWCLHNFEGNDGQCKTILPEKLSIIFEDRI